MKRMFAMAGNWLYPRGLFSGGLFAGGLFASAVFASGLGHAAEPVTAQNWEQHPQIVEIRAIYREVQHAIKAGKLVKKVREFDCSKLPEADSVHQQDYYEGGVRILYTARDGTPRFYYREGGSEDSLVREEYYYDTAGRLRFTFVRGGAENGTHMETRVYYSAAGQKLWQDDRVLEGPGYYFLGPAEITDPVEAFSEPDRCPDYERPPPGNAKLR